MPIPGVCAGVLSGRRACACVLISSAIFGLLVGLRAPACARVRCLRGACFLQNFALQPFAGIDADKRNPDVHFANLNQTQTCVSWLVICL